MIATIDSNYDFQACAFMNGDQQNQGSCKLVESQQLDKQARLNGFAEHYQEVLHNPNSDSHQNIR